MTVIWVPSTCGPHLDEPELSVLPAWANTERGHATPSESDRAIVELSEGGKLIAQAWRSRANSIPYPSILCKRRTDHRRREEAVMAHTVRERQKLINRVRRIRGQINGIEKLLENDSECGVVLQTLAACRGALNARMAEILEDHIRFHVVDPEIDPESEQAQA